MVPGKLLVRVSVLNGDDGRRYEGAFTTDSAQPTDAAGSPVDDRQAEYQFHHKWREIRRAMRQAGGGRNEEQSPDG